mgnify:FL=1
MPKKLKYVVTSGKHINIVLHKGNYLKIRTAIKKARMLQRKGKENVCIKSFRKGESLNHIKCLKN